MTFKTLALSYFLTATAVATDCVDPISTGPNAGVNLFVEVDLLNSNEQPDLSNTLDGSFLKTLKDEFGLCSPITVSSTTGSPTSAPIALKPSPKPSQAPSKPPTKAPTKAPTMKPTSKPSASPTKMPTIAPTPIAAKPTPKPSSNNKPTTPGAVDDFEFYQGTCRTHDMKEGVKNVDWIVKDGLNFSDCLAECRKDDGCKAFEHVASYCEIWKTYPPKADPLYPNHVCFKRKTNDSKPTSKPVSKPVSKPTMPSPVDDFEYNQGTCRTASMTEGEEGVDWIAMDGLTFSECLAECRHENDCKAFEHVASYCEIWKTMPPKSDSSYNNHVCFKKKDTSLLPTPPALVDDFEYKQGTCRTESMEVGKEGEDWIAMDGMTYAECLSECRNDSGCKGFEHVESYCEIWKTVPAKADSSFPNHVCLKKKESKPKPSKKPTKKPTSPAPVDGFDFNQGTCRTQNMEVGAEEVDWIAMDDMTFSECLAECKADGNCKGFEHVGTYCEIWMTVPSKVDSTFPNHVCYKKKDTAKPSTKPKPTHKPVAKPTHKPTMPHHSDFQYYQGTCRTETMGTGSNGVDWHSKDGLNLSECLTECFNDDGCKAVEHVGSYCELWKTLPPKQDASFASHACYKKSGSATKVTTKPNKPTMKPIKPTMKPTPSPTYTKPKPTSKPVAKPTSPTFSDDFVHYQGTCRTADMGTGKNGIDWIAMDDMNFLDCLMECYNDDSCKAIEHTGTYCELWRTFPAQNDDSYTNHSCYKKKMASKPISNKPSHYSKPNERGADRKRSLQESTISGVTGITIQNTEVAESESCEATSGEACKVVYSDVIVYAEDEATAQEAAARVVELLNNANSEGTLFSDEENDIGDVRVSTRVGLAILEPTDEDAAALDQEEETSKSGGRSTTFKVLMSLLGIFLFVVACILVFYLFCLRKTEEDQTIDEEPADGEFKVIELDDADDVTVVVDESRSDDGMMDSPDSPPASPAWNSSSRLDDDESVAV